MVQKHKNRPRPFGISESLLEFKKISRGLIEFCLRQYPRKMNIVHVTVNIEVS
jgi:hypothetical protein